MTPFLDNNLMVNEIMNIITTNIDWDLYTIIFHFLFKIEGVLNKNVAKDINIKIEKKKLDGIYFKKGSK